jgi:hypothetical protein
MSKERRLKIVEGLATQLAKEREEELPRVAGKTRRQALSDMIDVCQNRLTKPDLTDEQQQILKKNIEVMTAAMHAYD